MALAIAWQEYAVNVILPANKIDALSCLCSIPDSGNRLDCTQFPLHTDHAQFNWGCIDYFPSLTGIPVHFTIKQ